jgi:hypothetical protein
MLGSGCGDAGRDKAMTKNPGPARTTAGSPETAPRPGQLAASESAAAENRSAASKSELPERPIVYPALQLAAVMDFRKFPALKGSERLSRRNPARLEMKVNSKVSEAAGFYVSQLESMGWKVDEAAGKKTVNDSEAVVFFTKDGHIISLMGFPTDEKKPECMMMLIFHGNLDARTLPRSDGAKMVYGSPTQTIYTANKDLGAEADWITKSLAAQGWQRYVQGKRAQSASDQNRTIDFRKQGYALKAFLTKAPAQGNQTSVQYGVHAIGHELPAPADATEVEFDDDAWTMCCEVPCPMDKGVAFYREAMPAAGYKALSGEAPQERYVNLRFGTEAGDVICVQVAKKDEKTCKVDMFGTPAEVMEKIRQEEKKAIEKARKAKP